MSGHRLKRRPTAQELELELKRERYARRYRSVLKSTVFTLITVAAAAVLVATLWLPVLQIYGNSMAPTLQDGEIVLSFKSGDPVKGDVVAFYSNNKILVKRVIAQAGQWVDVDENGTVFVDDLPLEEPYLTDRTPGISDVEYPYQVPDGKVFVMGDHRETSVDSRNSAVGCVSGEQVVGKIFFRIWPMERFGLIR